jgi:hypothetical protein
VSLDDVARTWGQVRWRMVGEEECRKGLYDACIYAMKRANMDPSEENIFREAQARSRAKQYLSDLENPNFCGIDVCYEHQGLYFWEVKTKGENE